MKKIIHKADNRGHSHYDWLDSKHNFSFADYFNPNSIRFGALRVVNDDIVEAGTGFGKHPHDNMEIISIPLKGALKHKDSMNHEEIIKENEVQVMSAGTGLFHSEYNASQTERVNFLQLWIYPDKKNVEPVYSQKYFKPEDAENKWQFLVSNTNDLIPGSLGIHQSAKISRALLQKNVELKYTFRQTKSGSFLFIVHGEVEIDGETLKDRDAIGISEATEIKIKANKASYVLNVEVPMI